MQGSKLEDYASYADFSQLPAYWQPRKYVPKWLWNLVAEKHFAIESVSASPLGDCGVQGAQQFVGNTPLAQQLAQNLAWADEVYRKYDIPPSGRCKNSTCMYCYPSWKE